MRARLDDGAVRCWGRGGNGKLGYGNTNDIGDGETPSSAGDVPVGAEVIDLEAGDQYACAGPGQRGRARQCHRHR